jgi:hypothetical protein
MALQDTQFWSTPQIGLTQAADEANARFVADAPGTFPRKAVTLYKRVGGVDPRTTTTETIALASRGKLVTLSNAGAIAVTLTSTVPNDFFCFVAAIAAGNATLTPSSGTIQMNNGSPGASAVLSAGQSGVLFFDGTNWKLETGGTGTGGGGLNGVNVQTADYTILSGDNGKNVILNSGAAHIFTLPAAPPSVTWTVFISTIGTGALTVNRNGLTIDGVAANLPLEQFEGLSIWTDGSNYFTNGEPGILATKVGVQNGSYIYAVDTGSVNTYVVAPTPAITAYVAGQGFRIKAATTNTGASTLNVSGLGTKAITKNGTVALQGGEIIAGQIFEAFYDGTQFQLTGNVQDRPDRIVSMCSGLPAAGQIVCIYTAAWPISFPVNFANPNAYGSVGTNPTATATYTVYKNGVSVGTIAISTAGVFTFTTAGFSMNVGDRLTVVAPGSQDVTLSDVGFTLVGTRTAAISGSIGQGFFSWKGAYSGATAYSINDIVSYFGNLYICTAATTGNAPTNVSFWALAVQNQPGGAVTLDYLFSTTTTNSDPGSGLLRLNNATQNTATAAYINLTDFNGSGMTAVLDSLDVSTNTNKAQFRFTKKGDVTKWLIFYMTARVTHTGYREYTIANIASNTANPFSNNDELLVEVSIIGDAGAGVTAAQVQNETYTYATDGGSANAYAVTLGAAPASYVAGLWVAFKASNTNSGASTLDVNSLGTKNIKKWVSGSLVNLTAGDITANQIIIVIYDGTQFVTVGGGGGGNTTANYLLGAVDGTLTNSRVLSDAYLGPDVQPASAGSFDDEFSGGSMSGSWTWLNQGSATVTVSNGRSQILGDNAATSFRGMYEALPGTTPWEAVLKLHVEAPTRPAYVLAGVLLYEAGTTKLMWFGPFSVGEGISVGYGVGAGGVNSYDYTSTIQWNSVEYYKVRDNGTNLIFSISKDGVVFTQVLSQARTTRFTTKPDNIGFGVSLFTPAVGTTVCEWIRRTL